MLNTKIIKKILYLEIIFWKEYTCTVTTFKIKLTKKNKIKFEDLITVHIFA
jgi:hypothetical protein